MKEELVEEMREIDKLVNQLDESNFDEEKSDIIKLYKNSKNRYEN
ncbi:MAG: hypothetical protein ABIB46_03510 [bacterium]